MTGALSSLQSEYIVGMCKMLLEIVVLMGCLELLKVVILRVRMIER